MTTTYAADDQQVIDRVEANLLSGYYFTLIANSHNSVPKGGPPVTAEGWGAVIEALGKYARMGDRSAAAARVVVGKVNLYATANEVVAQVANALAEVAREGYYDVVRATGPEPGRPSSHQKATDLRTALSMALLMVEVTAAVGYVGHVPGVGWVVRHLVERENMTVYPMYLPRVAQMLAA